MIVEAVTPRFLLISARLRPEGGIPFDSDTLSPWKDLLMAFTDGGWRCEELVLTVGLACPLASEGLETPSSCASMTAKEFRFC